MAKTCRQAVEEVFNDIDRDTVLTTRAVVDRIYQKYPSRPWKRNSISAHLIGLSVNHHSSQHQLTLRKHAFLFSLGNGNYRKWDPEKDGIWEIKNGRVLLADSSEMDENNDALTELETEAKGTTLSLERDLEYSLLSNLEQLEPGLMLLDEKEIAGTQIESGIVGRLDILCIDQKNNLVVIELKAGKANDRVCGQILRYMGWVKENLAGDRDVRGIIVANEFTNRLKYASTVMPNVSLKKYEIRFEFTEI